MKSLFNQSDSGEIVNRINNLSSNSKPKWGKMNVSQMLSHSQRPLQVAFGEVKLKRSLIGKLFGKMAKKKLTGDAVFDKNLPTDKSFIVKDNKDFDYERKKLIELVTKFRDLGPNGISKEPHPFFGVLTDTEWDTLMWKHLDHHLRQFGV